MSTPYASLLQTEAVERRRMLSELEYDIELDLTEEATFASRSTIRFRSLAGVTFVDVKPVALRSARLDGQRLDLDSWARGRLPLTLTEGAHELVIEAVMPFRTDGEGLHRSSDPADGRHYVYGMSFMDAAPSIFACFDQPDLKAPYTFQVRAPEEWIVFGNAPCVQTERGLWEFQRTEPLSTYFVTIVAGPYHLIEDEHDGIPLSLSVRTSLAGDLDRDAEEIFTLTKQSFDELHRLFGIRYAFGKYHQAFVPEFNAGAMENPGCVTFRDPLVFSSRASRSQRISRATTIAHEMAHQWFGDLVTPVWWDDLWLNESFAEYLGTRVTADATQYSDAWVESAYSRRPWGLIGDQSPSTHPVAGNGAKDGAAALQDFDGISYEKGCAVLRQLNLALGDEVFFSGLADHFNRHRFANATMDDLFESWASVGAGDLAGFAQNWLRTSGVDRIEVDRGPAVLRRTVPKDSPADREHRLEVLVATGDEWLTEQVTIGASPTPLLMGDQAVVLDPRLETWAVTPVDEATARALVDLLPGLSDPMVRAGVWNGVRSALHNALIDPALVLDLVLAAPPLEDFEDSGMRTMAWVYDWVLPLQDDPAVAMAGLHQAVRACLDEAPPTSDMRFAAFRAAVATAASADTLDDWLAGNLPEGIHLDLDLRWRILTQLAGLGGCDLAEIDRHLAAEPTGASRVWHARARASLPTAESKAWAWSCFLGETRVANYELEAAGRGMWRAGQAAITAHYVERYFADVASTAQIRRGWMLGAAATAFFPTTSLDQRTLERARATIASPGIDAAIRRQIIDQTDLLARRLDCLQLNAAVTPAAGERVRPHRDV